MRVIRRVEEFVKSFETSVEHIGDYNLKKKLAEIVGLAYLDFEPYIEKNFTTIDDWKYNYELIKQKRREYAFF